MGKNKSLTEEEREIHRKATSLRKLTDKQLVERLSDTKLTEQLTDKQLIERLERISSSGKLPPMLTGGLEEQETPEILNPWKTNETIQSAQHAVSGFLDAIEHADIAGIGKVTIKKLNDFARENKFI